MKENIEFFITAVSFLARLVLPLGIGAQRATAPAKKEQHHHYKLEALGTLGGTFGEGGALT